jgi:hypothetical protein
MQFNFYTFNGKGTCWGEAGVLEEEQPASKGQVIKMTP